MASAPEFAQLYIRLRSRSDGAPLAPPELKARLVDDAAEQGTNMQAVAVAILARHFGVRLPETVARKATASSTGREINLKVPAELADRIAIVGITRRPKRTMQDEATAVLCAHYGLRVPPPPVRVRRRRRRPGAAASATAA